MSGVPGLSRELRVRAWQDKFEGATFADVALNPDPTAVLFYDSFGYRQTEATSSQLGGVRLANLLEGFEYLTGHFSRYPGTRVPYLKFDLVAGHSARQYNLASRGRKLDSVSYKIHERSHDPIPVHFNVEWLPVDAEFHFGLSSECADRCRDLFQEP